MVNTGFPLDNQTFSGNSGDGLWGISVIQWNSSEKYWMPTGLPDFPVETQ